MVLGKFLRVPTQVHKWPLCVGSTIVNCFPILQRHSLGSWLHLPPAHLEERQERKNYLS